MVYNTLKLLTSDGDAYMHGMLTHESTYELTSITKVSNQWYIDINILATSVLRLYYVYFSVSDFFAR